MLDDLKDRAALSAALEAARRRAPRPLGPRLRERRVLAVLPQDERDLRPAWRFLLGIELARGLVLPVSLGGTVSYVPDAFAGDVLLVGEADRDWRGLPRRALVEKLWARRPDVAIDLSRPFRTASALVVGGSPAALRVGLHDPLAESFFDLMLAAPDEGEEGFDGTMRALGRYLSALEPPALPFREWAAHSAR